MSFAYLPWYTGDYLRDTRHLSPLKHGVYLLLLAHCWDQKGPVPLDEQESAGIANCRSHDEIEALRYVLKRFFVQMDDGWYNKRIQTEIERAESISRVRSEAGRKGYEARAKHLPNKSQASASTPTPTPIPSPPPRTSSVPQRAPAAKKPPSRGSRMAADWQPPDEWLDWACKILHCEKSRAVRLALEFRDYWVAIPGERGVKLDWQATWRNRIRAIAEREGAFR